MTKEIGTLEELNVKPGDVVEYVPTGNYHTVLEGKRLTISNGNTVDYEYNWDCSKYFRIVSSASDKPKLWRDMTPEEKGALLLAHHEGKQIEVNREILECGEWWEDHYPEWMHNYAYRIKPEPKVEAVNQGYKTNSSGRFVTTSSLDHATHVVTFNLIDGEPDCTSIKMGKLSG